MGIDVMIGIKVRNGAEPPANGSRVEGDFSTEDWIEDVPFCTHVLSSPTRYYGPGDERGPWPDISGLLLFLLMHPDVESVWYCGDNADFVEDDPFTLERLGEINRHYVENGHEPYSGRKVR